METPKDDALIGDTFSCLIGDTFARVKYGDRFFYDLEGQAGSFSIGMFIKMKNFASETLTLFKLINKI